MRVVATAGHVDHGKSTLVRALTGQDPDRLAEEHRRGLSIELGYCWTSLHGAGEVALVDVPGHERFLSTMLAGVGPVPAVLFVVAADDPWMPQAGEHLAALDAFQVTRGVVAVTRSDLADPAPMVSEVRRRLQRTSLDGSPVLPVSARTGSGLAELRTALVHMCHRLPTPDPQAPVRLWVDRRFTRVGAGTVITGTLRAGRVRIGDILCCADTEVRVRGIETLGKPVSAVDAVARVALRLGGGVPDVVRRGAPLVSPDDWHQTTVLDVRLATDHHRRLPERPILHIGSAAVPVRYRALAPDLARLRLEHALPLRIGDRLVLRDPGSRRLVGAVVVDPAPPALRRRGDAVRRVAELAPATGVVDLAAELARRRFASRSLLHQIGALVVTGLPQGTVEAGDWLIDAREADRMRQELERLVDDASAPSGLGLPMSAAAQALDLPDPALVSALVQSPLELSGGRIRRRGTGLHSEVAAAVERLAAALATAPFAAPDAERLAEIGLDAAALAVAARAGAVLRLGPGVVLLPQAEAAAAEALADLPQPFTASQARQRLGTSRRVVLPLLAHLDARRVTRRLPDDRRELIRRTELTEQPSTTSPAIDP